MRLVYKVFVNPQDDAIDKVLFRTSDDGHDRNILEGKAPMPGAIRRIPAYVEVSCDDSPESLKMAIEGLQRIQQKLDMEAKGHG